MGASGLPVCLGPPTSGIGYSGDATFVSPDPPPPLSPGGGGSSGGSPGDGRSGSFGFAMATAIHSNMQMAALHAKAPDLRSALGCFTVHLQQTHAGAYAQPRAKAYTASFRLAAPKRRSMSRDSPRVLRMPGCTPPADWEGARPEGRPLPCSRSSPRTRTPPPPDGFGCLQGAP